MKVLAVTRPRNSLEKSREFVEEMGYEFYGAPTIELFPEKTKEVEWLMSEIKEEKPDIVIFTSKNGVRFFFEDLGGDKLLEELNNTRVVSIGPKTSEKLSKYGVESEVPKKYSSSGLVDYLKDDLDNREVLIARSSHGSEVLVNGLRENGADVHDIALYSIGLPKDTSHIEELIKDVLDGKIDILTFTSRMTFVNLMKVARELEKENELVDKMNKIMVSAIGEPTSTKIKEHGVSTVIKPKNYTFKDMIKTVVKED